MTRMAKCKKLNPKARATVLPLSGLLYCEKCGSRMGIRLVYQPDGSTCWRLKCGHRDANNDMCRQKGKHFDGSFLQKIYETVIKADENVLMELVNSHKQTSSVKPLLEAKKKELAKGKQAMERLFELWEEGNVSKSLFLERKATREAGIKKLQEEIKELAVLAEAEEARPTLQNIKRRIQRFKEEWWKVTSPKEQNMLLAAIVDKIYYNREGKIIYLSVQYK